MERTPVVSSSLASLGYDPASKILEVEFLESGDVYQYLNVPEWKYVDFMQSDSLGQFFITHIKEAGYSYRSRKIKKK